MPFGDILAELRLDRKLQQKDIAELLNVTVPTISHYEANKSSPDFNSIIKLADYFDVSVDYLLERVRTDINYKELEIAFVMENGKPLFSGNLLKRITKLSPSSRLKLIDYLEFIEQQDIK